MGAVATLLTGHAGRSFTPGADTTLKSQPEGGTQTLSQTPGDPEPIQQRGHPGHCHADTPQCGFVRMTLSRLGDAVMAIHAAAQHVHARLHGIRAEVDTGIGALQSTMDTTTGQQQMAEFLAAKTRDVQVVIDEAREASTIHMAALGEGRARYTTVRR